MTSLQTRFLLCCIALLGIGACKQADDSSKTPSADAEASSVALRERTASEKAAAENVKRLRVQELTSLISTAQSQREVLAKTKSTIETHLAAYQADSTTKLEQLKAEMQALERQKNSSAEKNSAKQMDAFNERARNQVEHALAMDQEYQAQLAQAADDLRKIDANMAAMRAEVATLRTEVR